MRTITFTTRVLSIVTFDLRHDGKNDISTHLRMRGFNLCVGRPNFTKRKRPENRRSDDVMCCVFIRRPNRKLPDKSARTPAFGDFVIFFFSGTIIENRVGRRKFACLFGSFWCVKCRDVCVKMWKGWVWVGIVVKGWVWMCTRV